MKDLSKIPPQAIELEEAVLGALMIDPVSIDEIIDIIRPESFYKDPHQKIYKAILQLHTGNKQIDILTVTEQLRKSTTLEEVGGPLYITQLTSKIASSAHIQEHAIIIEEKSRRRESIAIGSELISKAYDESTDIEETFSFLASSSDKLFDIGNSTGNESASIIKEVFNVNSQRQKLLSTGKLLGVPTPITRLNSLTGGWLPGQLIVIGGRPGSGKTAFEIECAMTDARNGGYPAIFSMEMSKAELGERILLGEAQVNGLRYKNCKLTPEEWKECEQAAARLLNYNFYIDDRPNITIEYIRAKSRQRKKKGKLSMICIDYLQLITSKAQKGKLRAEEVSEMSRACKCLGRELNVPVLLLSQLNRNSESRTDKKPSLADLRESGAIEQDADIVILIHRPEYYANRGENLEYTPGKGELLIEKNRNGAVGNFSFGYNTELTRIFDYVEPVSTFKSVNNYENDDSNDPPY